MASLADLLEEASAKRLEDMPGVEPAVPQPAPPPSTFGLDEPSTGPNMANLIPLLMGGGGGGGMGGGPAPVKGGPMGWISQALEATGKSQKWRDELYDLMMRESGGNPKAYNETPVASGQHARGLFQTIPTTFQAHNIPGLGGILNPVANAAAAINYIWGRYGNPNNLPTSGGY